MFAMPGDLVGPKRARGSSSGSSSGALTLLGVLTASNSATLDDTTHITSTYDEYEIQFENIVPASNNSNFYIRVTTDGGSTWKSSGYTGLQGITQVAMIPVIIDGSTPATVSSTAAQGGLCGKVNFTNPNSTSAAASVTGYCAANCGSSGAGGIPHFFGNAWVGTTAINGLRFMFNTGNITSGKVKIYGIQKS